MNIQETYQKKVGIWLRVSTADQAEGDSPERTKKERFFAFFRRGRRDFFPDQVHRVVEQHAEGFAGLFVFQNFTAEWIRGALVDPPIFKATLFATAL